MSFRARNEAGMTTLDAYLLLLKGHSTDGHGTALGRDDDSGFTPTDRTHVSPT